MGENVHLDKARICGRATGHNVLRLPSETPAGGDLRTLLSTHTMQSVRCAVFDRVTRAITNLALNRLQIC